MKYCSRRERSFYTGEGYSWIGFLSTYAKKSIPEQTKRVATNLRPRTESSRRGESRYAFWVYFCVVHFLPLIFKTTSQITPKQKYNKNQIRLVKYSCTEVSGPSDVTRFVRELIFYLVKELKLICVHSIILCPRVPAIG